MRSRCYDGGSGESRSPSPLPARLPAPGYEQYQKSLLEVPWPPAEYGEASSDDLSSEWDSDVPDPIAPTPKVGLFTVTYCRCFIVVCSWDEMPTYAWNLAQPRNVF